MTEILNLQSSQELRDSVNPCIIFLSRMLLKTGALFHVLFGLLVWEADWSFKWEMPDSSPITNNFKLKKKTRFFLIQILVNEELLLQCELWSSVWPFLARLTFRVILTLPLSCCFRTYHIIVAWSWLVKRTSFWSNLLEYVVLTQVKFMWFKIKLRFWIDWRMTHPFPFLISCQSQQ